MRAWSATKAPALLGRVGQLAERIGEFEAAHIKLEPLREPRVVRFAARQRGHRDRVIVEDRRRADPEMRLDALQKDAEEQRFPIVAGMRRDADARGLGGEQRGVRALRIGRRRQQIDAGMPGKRLGDGEPLPTATCVGPMAAPAQRVGAGRVLRGAQQPLAFVHQVAVRRPGAIPFEHREFGVVRRAALAVAIDMRELPDALGMPPASSFFIANSGEVCR